MTRLLASVRSRDEARIVLDAGADIIDLKEPSEGVLGALPIPKVREIVAEIAGRLPISATVGDLNADAGRLGAAAAALTDAGVDFVKVGLFEPSEFAGLLRALRGIAGAAVRIVLVLFAEREGHRMDLDAVADSGISGVMMDTADKHSGTLLEKVPREDLARFVRGARARGLMSGLAGALRAEDVAGALAFAPDYLGFRGALCKGGGREQRVCIRRTQLLRALMAGSADAASPMRAREAG